MDYDYARAAQLAGRADELLIWHRARALGPRAAAHLRSIRRIQRLMRPLWQAQASARTGERLARAGY